MGLETATFINGLTPSWPLSGDLKSQGDDHIRLLKATVQATFPNATRAFYLPTMEFQSAAMVLDATDQNNYIGIDTTAADVNVTLPASLSASDKGWSCDIFRTNTAGYNGIMVAAAAGSLSSPFGSAATCRIEFPIVPVKFVWTGSNWIYIRPGPLIGSSMNWDGATVPPGYRVADGTVYSTTTFVELGLALGTGQLRDKRGRVEAGVDGGTGRLTASWFGSTAILGAANGFEYHYLTQAEMPAHYHTASIYDPTHTHSSNGYGVASSTTGGGAFPIPTAGGITINASATGVRVNSSNGLDTTYSAGSGGAHTIVQPTIITNKVVRVA